MMKNTILLFIISVLSNLYGYNAEIVPHIGLYRTFERTIENNNAYSNKFNDVELKCTYISPSGDSTRFFGFFDGDGGGGGDSLTGNIWKIRFLPDEVGEWHYKWEWSDTTAGGEGTFICDSSNAGKGILRPYKENPRWFAYNGNDPVWLKSYYESGHGAIAQPFDWITENVYQPMLDRGYNHFQVNWLLSLCCFGQYYADGPAMSTEDLLMYESGKASSTMRLDVWQMMEQHIVWLNERDVGIHMFLGFDGGKNGTSSWESLSETEKDFYVRYVVARLAPYANIAGWSFVWEVPGDRLTHELGWAQLVKEYDVFDHLRTYHDEKPIRHEYERPEYNFAAIENHSVISEVRDEERQFWKEAWTHHYACLAGYVPGKPVYMIEGNALWRRYWHPKVGADRDDLRQSAWGCVTAGASFNWCGHQGSGPLKAFGPQGLPFHGDENEYASSTMQIDMLTDIMTNELEFYKMGPSNSLLSEHDTLAVWCLSEPGEQYLAFSKEGKPFKLQLSAGQYNSNQWISTMTGAGKIVTATENEIVPFTPPDTTTDWVLLIRKDWEQDIQEEANILTAETDSSGAKVYVSCNKEIIIPDDYIYGFKITEKGKSSAYSIKSIALDSTNIYNVIIELNDTILLDKAMVMSYVGTLVATDSSILAPTKDMAIKNNSKTEPPIINSVNTIQKANYMVYPNPCTDQVEISCDEIMKRIQIFDVSGISVFEKRNVDQCIIHIDLKDITAGLYVLSVTTSNGTIVKNFIKR